jgi:hypothetical protein
MDPIVKTSFAALAASIAAALYQWLKNDQLPCTAPKPTWRPFGLGYMRSIDDVEREAKDRLPPYLWEYIQFTAGKQACARVREAFEAVLLQSRLLRNVSSISLDVMVAHICFNVLMHLLDILDLLSLWKL